MKVILSSLQEYLLPQILLSTVQLLPSYSAKVKGMSVGSLLNFDSRTGKPRQKWFPRHVSLRFSRSCNRAATCTVPHNFIPELFPSTMPVSLSHCCFIFGSPLLPITFNPAKIFKLWYFFSRVLVLKCELYACNYGI